MLKKSGILLVLLCICSFVTFTCQGAIFVQKTSLCPRNIAYSVIEIASGRDYQCKQGCLYSVKRKSVSEHILKPLSGGRKVAMILVNFLRYDESSHQLGETRVKFGYNADKNAYKLLKVSRLRLLEYEVDVYINGKVYPTGNYTTKKPPIIIQPKDNIVFRLRRYNEPSLPLLSTNC